MSEPEISRRCLSCGATVRQSAAFCPQCGQVLDKREQAQGSETELQPNSESTMLDQAPIDPPASELAPTAVEHRSPETVILRKEEELLADEVIEEKPSPQNFETRPLSPTPAAPISETPPSVLARVEKLRKASSVMIDQAAYDPSLRFLLVAALLFVLFVVLMILSKVVG